MTHHRSTIRLFAAALALVATVSVAHAASRIQLLEQAYETTSAEVTVPGVVDRSVLLPGCTKTCPPAVQLTRESRFWVGNREVTLAQLRMHLASGRVGLTIFYEPQQRVLTRIVAY